MGLVLKNELQKIIVCDFQDYGSCIGLGKEILCKLKVVKPPTMNEEFLHYVWKHQMFSSNNLKTTKGKSIEILKQGDWNFDAGPDFFNARIKLDQTTWAGNVEIHLKGSDWNLHKHHLDPAYNNVILHVVATDNADVYNHYGDLLPVLVLCPRKNAIKNYKQLLASPRWPACHETISEINPIYISLALQSLVVERLETKIRPIEKLLEENKNNWNETFYQVLSGGFGFKTNTLPFEMLARSLPLNILQKHKNNSFQIEALLFGQAGMLNKQLLGDDYFLSLRAEYSHLSNKYDLQGNAHHLWKFMRLRPSNFPTIRIAQFANLIYKSSALLSKVIESAQINDLIQFFNIEASTYWDTHYHFDQSARKQKKRFGNNSVKVLIINTIIPFLFVYGEKNNLPNLKDRSFQFLEQLSAEQNSIIKRWKELGVNPLNAAESQALIQLKNVYCESKKCLNCKIGTKVINR